MAASVPLKKDTKPWDKEGDKKSEVVRYPRLRRARAGVMLKAVLAGMGQVSGGSSQVTRLLGATPHHLETAAATSHQQHQGFVTGETWV